MSLVPCLVSCLPLVSGEIFCHLQHEDFFSLSSSFQQFLSPHTATHIASASEDTGTTTTADHDSRQLLHLRRARAQARKILSSKIANTEKLLQALELQRSPSSHPSSLLSSPPLPILWRLIPAVTQTTNLVLDSIRKGKKARESLGSLSEL